MGEYIELDAAVAALKNLVSVTRRYADGDPDAIEMFVHGICTAIGILLADEAIPRTRLDGTNISKEERLGKWVEVEDTEPTWVCSECGQTPWWCGVTEDVLPPHCPSCGAMMEYYNE